MQGTDAKASAEREFFEETGIVYKLDEASYKTMRLSNTRFYIECVETMFRVAYKDVVDKHEIKDIRWVPVDDLLCGKYNMNSALREFIKKYGTRAEMACKKPNLNQGVVTPCPPFTHLKKSSQS